MEFDNKLETNHGKVGNPNWQKGMVSPNAGGRPKRIESLVESCKELTPDALARVYEIMMSPKSKGADVLTAARLIIEYGFGKPQQQLQLDITAKVEAMTTEERAAKIKELYAKMNSEEVIDI